MKFKELKNKPEKELRRLLVELRNQLREFRFKVSSNQLKNIREIREIRKTIARLLFLLGEKKPAKEENK